MDRRLRNRGFGLVLALVAVLTPAACSLGGSATTNPTGSVPASTGAASAAPAASLPSQSDTEWGRIWDAIPSSFPSPAGAQIATDTGEGATSALLTVPGQTVETVAEFYTVALQDADYIVGVDGPLEDGSVTISATEESGCTIRVSVRPAGDSNLVAVLYGATCPFE